MSCSLGTINKMVPNVNARLFVQTVVTDILLNKCSCIFMTFIFSLLFLGGDKNICCDLPCKNRSTSVKQSLKLTIQSDFC